MKTQAAFFAVIQLFVVMSLPSCAQAASSTTTTIALQTYTGPFNNLVWSDEFNTTQIDTSVWKYETTETGWSNSWNNELQDYVDDGTGGDNAFIAKDSDGTSALVLRATRTKTANKIHSFKAARLTTQGTKSFDHGRIEVRMALPKGNGVWPSIWMLGNEGSWPTNGELDIMEMIGGTTGAARGGGDDVAFSTCHWGVDPGHPSFQRKHTFAPGTGSQYHIYTLNWDSQNITISIDGNAYFPFDISEDDTDCFHKQFYLLINFAVGGNWGGNPDASTVFPQDFKIDYIRVYQ